VAAAAGAEKVAEEVVRQLVHLVLGQAQHSLAIARCKLLAGPEKAAPAHPALEARQLLDRLGARLCDRFWHRAVCLYLEPWLNETQSTERLLKRSTNGVFVPEHILEEALLLGVLL
jgi:hypothetical protein